ncbi:cell division protein FtsL [Pararhodospirillum photometricum]|nr:hypothetical protein [Pararhodospirillum photometricum]
MIRASHLVWGALIMTVGTGLFLVANEVGAREKELARLYADIRRTTESLHVLRAEWSYLNDPSRLERLASTHLGLEPVRPEQYVSVNQLPLPPAETGEGLPASLPGGKGGRHPERPVGQVPERPRHPHAARQAGGSGRF